MFRRCTIAPRHTPCISLRKGGSYILRRLNDTWLQRSRIMGRKRRQAIHVRPGRSRAPVWRNGNNTQKKLGEVSDLVALWLGGGRPILAGRERCSEIMPAFKLGSARRGHLVVLQVLDPRNSGVGLCRLGR